MVVSLRHGPKAGGRGFNPDPEPAKEEDKSMRRSSVTVIGLAILFSLSTATAFAQRGGAGQGNDVVGAGMIRNRENSTVGNTNAGVTADGSVRETPAQILSGNKKLSSTVQTLLPEGTDVLKAAQGFSSLVKFVSAAHASQNLGIPFSDLKTKMTKGDKLEKAIQALKPDADAKEESKKAEKQAKTDIKDAKA